ICTPGWALPTLRQMPGIYVGARFARYKHRHRRSLRARELQATTRAMKLMAAPEFPYQPQTWFDTEPHNASVAWPGLRPAARAPLPLRCVRLGLAC
ncbi:MAG: hypothetical protein KAJ19_09825, partial [Gammaproteobacteria bacterium]|nr:hypothetical protein [Gammaproteobacteria bacterium]